MRTPSAVALALGLVACGPPESIPQADYALRMAEVTCQRLEECQRGDFERLYYGMDDCREELRRSTQSTIQSFEELDCDYDAKKAADVWVLIHDMNCEKFFEGEYDEEQSEVWECY